MSAGYRVFPGTTWRTQYERMKRTRHKLDRPYDVPAEYDDDVVHFFQDALHLRDWLTSDWSWQTGARKNAADCDAVAQWVKDHEALQAASDIANGTKHPERDKAPYRFMVRVRKHVNIHVGPGAETAIEMRSDFADAQGKEQSASDLADDVIREWDDFLRSRGLLP
jgi:hypothetical protein